MYCDTFHCFSLQDGETDYISFSWCTKTIFVHTQNGNKDIITLLAYGYWQMLYGTEGKQTNKQTKQQYGKKKVYILGNQYRFQQRVIGWSAEGLVPFSFRAAYIRIIGS